MRRVLTLLLAAALVGFSAAVFAQDLVECDEKTKRFQAEYVEELRRAKPGDQLHVQVPMPSDAAQVVANVKGQLLPWVGRSIKRKTTKVASLEALRLGLERNTFRYQVTEVRKWNPLRCFGTQPADRYFLVQIFSKAPQREEVVRATVSDYGLLTSWMEVTRETHAVHVRQPILDLVDTSRRAREEWGLPAEVAAPGRGFYVETEGRKLRCLDVDPCVVFRDLQRGLLYLFHKGEDPELPGRAVLEAFRIDVKTDLREVPRVGDTAFFALDEEIARRGHFLMSVGGAMWAEVERLPEMAARK